MPFDHQVNDRTGEPFSDGEFKFCRVNPPPSLVPPGQLPLSLHSDTSQDAGPANIPAQVLRPGRPSKGISGGPARGFRGRVVGLTAIVQKPMYNPKHAVIAMEVPKKIVGPSGRRMRVRRKRKYTHSKSFDGRPTALREMNRQKLPSES